MGLFIYSPKGNYRFIDEFDGALLHGSCGISRLQNEVCALILVIDDFEMKGKKTPLKL
jgi:hypothetical protein